MKNNLKEQTATSVNGITFKLTETKMIESTAELQCPLLAECRRTTEFYVCSL